MKCSIHITGQISDNHILHNAICTAESKTERGMFYSYYLHFPTRKAAYKAMWDGYRFLRNDLENARNSNLAYSKHYSVRYDASMAKIVE